MPVLETIGAIAPFAGAGIGAAAQGNANRKNRKFQDKVNKENRQFAVDMYYKQRDDSLADWNMQNHYNSPEQMMNRYRQAGLNPNLIYGKGGDSTASMVRSSQAPQGNAQAPQIQRSGVAEGIQTFQNMKMFQAQTDQIYQNVALAKAEETLKQLSASNMAIKNAYDQNSLELARKLNDSVILKANLDNEYTKLKMDLDVFKNNREEVANSKNIEMTTEQIITEQLKQAQIKLQNATLPLQKQYIQEQINNLKVQSQNLKKEGLIKDFEIKMNQAGIDKNSPWYTKFLNHYLNGGNPLTLDQINEMKKNVGKTPMVPYKIPTRG